MSRRRSREFEGSVSLEAYLAQFELLVQGQGWDHDRKAVQLAISLKGLAVEVLRQMTPDER